MDDLSLVHWHEGLFLRPHQLQHMQRSLARRQEVDRRLHFAYPTGVIEMEMSHDALENFQVRIDRLWAALPSGLIVRFPEDANLPPLEFKDQFQSSAHGLVVYLAVPLPKSPGPDVVDNLDDPHPWKYAVRQCVELREMYDENSGTNPTQEPVRRVNARLLTEADLMDEMEAIPLLKLIRSTADAEGGPRTDPDWVAPSLVLSGSERLRLIVRDLAQHLESVRARMMQTLSAASYRVDNLQGVQLAQFLRLRSLGRFSTRFAALASSARSTTPFTAWREMAECLQELAALSPEQDDGRIRAYNHDALGPLFEDLDQRIRRLTEPTGGARPREIEFTKQQIDYEAAIPSDAVAACSAWYLGVRTNDDVRAVNEIVEDELNFQLLPEPLRRRRIPGVPLEYDKVGHHALEPRPGLHYYRLNLNSDMWNQIVDVGAAVIRFNEVSQVDWRLTLHGIPNA